MSDSEAMRIWEKDLYSKALNTQKLYVRYFTQFLDYYDLTGDDFYEEVVEAVKKRYEKPRLYRGVHVKVKNYMAELRRSGKSASTCKQVYKSVRSFLESQGIEEFSLRAKDKPKGESEGQRLILPDQICEIYDKAGAEFQVRNRAIVMFLKDSGLRISDTVNLNVGDYVDAETSLNEAGEPFKAFAPFETQKMKVIAHIHIGPESVKAIDDYLNERRRNKLSVDAGSPLFLMRNNERFTTNAMTVIMRRLSKKLGKSGYRISAHSLRKFHTTMLESAMPRSYVGKLQGKKASGSMGPYEKPEEIPGELLKFYMKGYTRLRIFGEEIETKKKLTEISKENRDLKERLKEIEIQLKMIPLFQEEIDRYELGKRTGREYYPRVGGESKGVLGRTSPMGEERRKQFKEE